MSDYQKVKQALEKLLYPQNDHASMYQVAFNDGVRASIGALATLSASAPEIYRYGQKLPEHVARELAAAPAEPESCFQNGKGSAPAEGGEVEKALEECDSHLKSLECECHERPVCARCLAQDALWKALGFARCDHCWQGDGLIDRGHGEYDWTGKKCEFCKGAGRVPSAAIAASPQGEAEPIPDDIAADLARADWTPEKALRFYAAGRHFDTVQGRTRILDNGAIASNALKALSPEHLELKGDAELSDLRAQLTEKERELEEMRNELTHERAQSDHIRAQRDAKDRDLGAAISFRVERERELGDRIAELEAALDGSNRLLRKLYEGAR